MRSDSTIARDIKKTLALEAPEIHHKVNVQVLNGHVTLSGAVATPYEKWLSWDAASRVSGAKSISDQLQVRPAIAKVSDSEIKQRIQRTLNIAGVPGQRFAYYGVGIPRGNTRELSVWAAG